VSLAGKLIREITPAEVQSLVAERAVEDSSLDFKERLFAGPSGTWDHEGEGSRRPSGWATAGGRKSPSSGTSWSRLDDYGGECYDGGTRVAMPHDIAELLEITDTLTFLQVMQREFEDRIGSARFFRLTATPCELGAVSANLEDPTLRRLLEAPPNPNQRFSGWDVRPLPPLRRNALGFENERVDFHHLKFIKNGHLEFWTAIDDSFCWRQDPESFQEHPRLYPYPVVEHPVSFCRLYGELVRLLGVGAYIILQMQYLNIRGAVLLPYNPESIRHMYPMEAVSALNKDRLVFEKKRFPPDFDPDPVALSLIKDLYYEFGYGREHIPFFDDSDHSQL
jgi:hypothetical protein